MRNFCFTAKFEFVSFKYSWHRLYVSRPIAFRETLFFFFLRYIWRSPRKGTRLVFMSLARLVSLAFEARDWMSDVAIISTKDGWRAQPLIKVSFFSSFSSGPGFPALCVFLSKKLLSWCSGAHDSACTSFRPTVCRLQITKEFSKEPQDLSCRILEIRC